MKPDPDPWVDPPFFLLLFKPLTRFTPATAFFIWTAINIAILAIAIYVLLVRRPGFDASTGWLPGRAGDALR